MPHDHLCELCGSVVAPIVGVTSSCAEVQDHDCGLCTACRLAIGSLGTPELIRAFIAEKRAELTEVLNADRTRDGRQ